MKIQDEFIPYSEALSLKELGFDEPCLGNYKKTGSLHVLHYGTCGSTKNDNFNILAPLYQQAFRWFREKYGIDSSINKQHHIDKYCVSIDLNGFYADDDLFQKSSHYLVLMKKLN